MAQIDTSHDRPVSLAWRLPTLPALAARVSTLWRTDIPTGHPDQFELSREGADRLARCAGIRAGNW